MIFFVFLILYTANLMQLVTLLCYNFVQVYELESLFIALLDHAGQAAPSKQYAVEILTSTTHDFQPGIKCNFHEELECQHCSLLWVRKFWYVHSKFTIA